ncbi:o-succinylbenzoate synthase [Dictyobacter arantiisoli]|nr:o-succinylbenzoate synthase [Dictyobacter arantiisoli]
MEIGEIGAVRWYVYRVPLPGQLSSAHETLAIRAGVMVEIETRSGLVGCGECAPLPAFRGGSLEDVLALLPAVAQQLYNQTFYSALALVQQTGELALSFALEAALLDLAGQYYHCSVAALLALPDLSAIPLNAEHRPIRDVVAVNTVIGSQEVGIAVRQAEVAVAAGFTCVKLKVGRDTQLALEVARSIREALGPAIHLRLDANEAWNFEQARAFLRACEPLKIQYVEQPLPRDDLAGMALLRKCTTIPLAADEVLSDLASARCVLTAQAADILIVKPQLTGGLLLARQMIHEASVQGVRCVVTSTIEAGVGVMSALQLAAASPEIQLECGLATLQMLADDLIVETIPVKHGHMALPGQAGLGVHLDKAALAKYQ